MPWFVTLNDNHLIGSFTPCKVLQFEMSKSGGLASISECQHDIKAANIPHANPSSSSRFFRHRPRIADISKRIWIKLSALMLLRPKTGSGFRKKIYDLVTGKLPEVQHATTATQPHAAITPKPAESVLCIRMTITQNRTSRNGGWSWKWQACIPCEMRDVHACKVQTWPALWVNGAQIFSPQAVNPNDYEIWR